MAYWTSGRDFLCFWIDGRFVGRVRERGRYIVSSGYAILIPLRGLEG